jgi:predicted lipoprotein
MTATVTPLRTHTEQMRQDDALYIGQLEDSRMALNEELAQAHTEIELLREQHSKILEQYAAAMDRLTRALEWKGQATLAAIAIGLGAVLLLRLGGL